MGAVALEIARKGYTERINERGRHVVEARQALQHRARKLREFMEQSYDDKLEGRIPSDLWEKKNAAWKTERPSESAPGRSSVGTSRGISAWREGPSKATAEAERAFRM